MTSLWVLSNRPNKRQNRNRNWEKKGKEKYSGEKREERKHSTSPVVALSELARVSSRRQSAPIRARGLFRAFAQSIGLVKAPPTEFLQTKLNQQMLLCPYFYVFNVLARCKLISQAAAPTYRRSFNNDQQLRSPMSLLRSLSLVVLLSNKLRKPLIGNWVVSWLNLTIKFTSDREIEKRKEEREGEMEIERRICIIQWSLSPSTCCCCCLQIWKPAKHEENSYCNWRNYESDHVRDNT